MTEEDTLPAEGEEAIVQNDTVEVIQESDDELKAREQGWVPQEEFPGPKENWMDAKTFLKKRDVESLREQVGKLTEEARTRREQTERQAKILQETQKLIIEREQAAYERGKRELDDKLREAVSTGDVETFDKLKKEQDDLISRGAPKKIEPEKPEIPEEEIKVFNEWLKDNEWFGKYPRLTDAAKHIRMDKSKSQREQLDEVARIIRADFADHEAFRNARRDRPPALEGGNGTRPPQKRTGKTFADLPDEAQEVCKRMERRKEMTRDEYVKAYFA